MCLVTEAESQLGYNVIDGLLRLTGLENMFYERCRFYFEKPQQNTAFYPLKQHNDAPGSTEHEYF